VKEAEVLKIPEQETQTGPGKCEECSLSIRRMVPGYGPDKANVVIVGEAPGRMEVLEGRPFVGQSGKLLDAMLEGLGYHRKDVYTTNVCLCRPDENREPTDHEIMCCNERLYEEIKSREPKVVIAMGKTASRTLFTEKFEDATLLDTRGMFRFNSRLGCKVFSTFHPAYLLRSPDQFNVTMEDLETALNPDIWDKTYNVEDVTYHVCTTALEAVKELEKHKDGEVAVIDVETDGYNMNTNRLLCAGICFDGKHVIVIPEKVLYDPFFRWNCKLGRFRAVGHNIKFDAKFISKQLGVKINIYGDTMLQHYVQLETQGTHGLKNLLGRKFGVPDYKQEVFIYLKKKSDSFRGVPPEILHKYVSRDAAFTRLLWEVQSNEIKGTSSEKVYETVMMPVERMLTEIEQIGIRVDPEYATAIHAKMSKVSNEIVKKIRDAAGLPNLNPNSPKQVAHLLYEQLALPSRFKGSTRKEALQKLEHLHPIVSDLLALRRNNKLLNTYVDKVLRVKDENDMLYPDYRLHGTTSGRLSCRGGRKGSVDEQAGGYPIQTIPREGGIREMFIPTKEGNVFVMSDYNQAEVRMMAILSGDENLRKVLEGPLRLHKYYAIMKYGENYTKSEYIRAKAIVFGISYGRKARSVAEEFNITLVEAQGLIDDYFERFPKLKEWIDKVHNDISNGVIPTSFFGRQRHFGLITDANRNEVMNEAVNFYCQGPASDVTILSAVKVCEELGPVVRALLHDSIMIEVPLEEYQEAACVLKDIMESTPHKCFDTKGILFPCDVHAATRWSDEDEYSLPLDL